VLTATAEFDQSQLAAEVDYLFRVAYRLTGDAFDAEDLVQDVCERALRRAPELASSRDCRRWLLRVLYNRFLDGRRRRRRSPIVASQSGGTPDVVARDNTAGPEGLALEAEAETGLVRAWERLEADQQALLMLRAEGHDLDEIAEITELEKPVLSSRLYRARTTLARYLREEESRQPLRAVPETAR
jgi:RNA polymerase sigma-70 factor (ECF subfamily)